MMASLAEVVRVRLDEIKARVITGCQELEDWEIRIARHLGPDQYRYETDWRSLRVGEIWGRPGVTAFLRRRVGIPPEWAGRRVALQLETGGEGLLSIDGVPYHGIDDHRTYILLAASARGGEVYDLLAELKAGGYWEWQDETGNQGDKPCLFRGARSIAIDRAVEEAYLDFSLAHEAAVALGDPDLQEAVLTAINASLRDVDFREQGEAWVKQLAAARQDLRPRLEGIRSGDSPARIFFTGHSHVDVAWLWPLRKTIRKCGRTYATVAALMDEFPDYHFNCSQVPLFIYTQKHYPTVYEKLKARIAEGRLEPIGGTWVEHDTNLLSGESLVRQCLYGQRFFRRELGVEVRVGWLPDTFGFSWSMPQIYKEAGLDYFMTTKLSWNDTNKFPYGLFWWEGIDGTRLFTSFINGSYNAMVKPSEMLKLWESYPNKQDYPELLSPFGWGDGGGGPTREMLEAIPRLADLPGLPKARMGRVHDFFDRAAAETDNLPIWNGELYFELHRGTYTSQARNKRSNRKSELLYREAEMLCAFAAPFGKPYPERRLSEGWETILLNQFHDIIPGSSVTAVYAESQAQYARVQESAQAERGEALAALVRQADTGGAGTPIVVFNTLSWTRNDLADVDVPTGGSCRVVGPDGREVPCQISGGRLSFEARDLPPLGFAVYRITPGPPLLKTPFVISGSRIATPYYELELQADGTLSRVYDKLNAREVLSPGVLANRLQFFEDKPTAYEAWDVELQYQDRVWEAAVNRPLQVLEDGPVRLVLGVTLSYGQSVIEQEIVLYAHTPRIDFRHQVGWRARRTLLKVAFPVEIRSPRATYEIAFGAIERPTHWNTGWDRARFEVPGHKWADLSEADYGVSVLNDCKYGWDIHGNVIRLSLLRSPISPDPEADQGRQEYTYSLLPHAGDWRNGTVRAGYELNVPLLAMAAEPHPGPLGAVHSFVKVDKPNVIVDTIKKAEEGDDLVIRLYEAHGARGPATITFDRRVVEAVECGLLEEGEAPVSVDGNRLNFAVRPFELKTFRVNLEVST